jgi:hypothetical protein
MEIQPKSNFVNLNLYSREIQKNLPKNDPITSLAINFIIPQKTAAPLAGRVFVNSSNTSS